MIIKQGDIGEELFIVDAGVLDCYKIAPGSVGLKYLKQYHKGDTFGELALLYNVPRAATVETVTDCVLFVLGREYFSSIVKDNAIQKRKKYESFLYNVQILQSMENYERSKICDALVPCEFKKGDYIIKQGDEGDTFYILEQGECVATRIRSKGIQL